MPEATIEELSLEDLKGRRDAWRFPELALAAGTIVRVTGYHGNSKAGLEHALLRDYVRWFTRWGSWEPKLAAAAAVDREMDEEGETLGLRQHGADLGAVVAAEIDGAQRVKADHATSRRTARVKDP